MNLKSAPLKSSKILMRDKDKKTIFSTVLKDLELLLGLLYAILIATCTRLISNKHGRTMLSILLVEDNLEQRTLIKAMLSDSEFNIIEASNGIEALELIRSKPNIDLAICDIIMPEMDGMKLVQILHSDYPNVPIIVMSGGGAVALNYYVEIQQRKLAKTISKPFFKDELLNLVNETIEA